MWILIYINITCLIFCKHRNTMISVWCTIGCTMSLGENDCRDGGSTMQSWNIDCHALSGKIRPGGERVIYNFRENHLFQKQNLFIKDWEKTDKSPMHFSILGTSACILSHSPLNASHHVNKACAFYMQFYFMCNYVNTY